MQRYATTALDGGQVSRWREFAATLPSQHFWQDPAWGYAESGGPVWRERRPHYFWCEDDGRLCLTALGLKRTLPIPGMAFWEFPRGPLFEDPEVFDDWLAWLPEGLGRGAARVIAWPYWRLDEGGDEIETILERHGFVRRRVRYGWSTLLVDLTLSDEGLLKSFRRQTRQNVRKSLDADLHVSEEDDPRGWTTLHELDLAMAERVATDMRSADRFSETSQRWLKAGGRGALLVERSGDTATAAAIVIVQGATATLVALPSRRVEGLPTSYLLVWEAMRWARERGCTTFDMGGYSLVGGSDDPLAGVKQFKRGFAPKCEPLRFVALHERVNYPLVQAMAGAGLKLRGEIADRGRRLKGRAAGESGAGDGSVAGEHTGARPDTG